MATLPKATTKYQETAGVPVGGLDVICVMAPVAKNPDLTPRLMGSAQAIFDQHDYSEGLEYSAFHIDRTGKGVLFVGCPIAVQGVLSRRNSDGNTGTSQPSVTAGSNGSLAEHDGVVDVVQGGVVGTDQIVLGLSLDGGRTFQKLRFGSGVSATIPYIGVVLALTTGSLVTGDTILTWHGSAPATDSAGRLAARNALAQGQKAFRSIMLIGDVVNHTDCQAFVDQLNGYETANERFVYGRASIADRLPLPQSSSTRHLTLNANLTYAATGHTITRAAGSWITDGYAIGDVVSSAGTVSNNGTHGAATGVSATVLTFASGLVNETITTATITGRTGLVFAASGNTATRNVGSWVGEGFAIGQSVLFAGTTSNNGTKVLTGVSATVLTFASGIVNETLALGVATVIQVLTKAAWMAAQDAEYSSIDDQPRIDISAGRGRVISPFSLWDFRRPAAWFASVREYAHDLHVATWRKSDGPVGADLFDEDGTLVEWDDRADGGAGCAARFTTLRTWGNGPEGAFIALSLTRAKDGSLLGLTNKMAVINLIQSTVQLNTENAAIGVDLILNDDGTATTESLKAVEKQVNDALEQAVLINAKGEGPRASKALWTADPSVKFNTPDPNMIGSTDANLNGTVHSVTSTTRVRTAA